MKKELYSVCELCKKEIFDMRECAEVIISAKLIFSNCPPERKEPEDAEDIDIPLYVGGSTLCADCFQKTGAIQKAIASRWYTTKLDEMINLSQTNFNANIEQYKKFKTKNQNKAFKRFLRNE